MSEEIYKPDKCPYGDCEKHQLISVGGPVYDCEICKQVHVLMEYAKSKEEEEE